MKMIRNGESKINNISNGKDEATLLIDRICLSYILFEKLNLDIVNDNVFQKSV